MSFKIVKATLSAAVANSGTVTFDYPTGTAAGSFAGFGHVLHVDKLQNYFKDTGFSLSFGASEITLTYSGATTIPTGAELTLQLNQLGPDDGVLVTEFTEAVENVALAPAQIVNLGAPVAADPNGVCEAQSASGAHTLSLDGALVEGGVATFDVPRNVVIDSGGADTAVLTIKGTDAYGKTVVENLTLNGTTAVVGKKAFKTITEVTSSATISNGAFVGTGVVLGLPVFLPETAYVLAELEDGASATAGTLVAGITAAATATTGDVRGTYVANSALDGSKVFELIAVLPDAEYLGVAQFAG